MTPLRTLILGAAGRDFHNFNVFFRDNPAHEVVAFTATQIPHIAERRYPPELAGPPLIRELEEMIDSTPADIVVVGTSIDLSQFLRINKPLQRARHELQEIGQPTLNDVWRERFDRAD